MKTIVLTVITAFMLSCHSDNGTSQPTEITPVVIAKGNAGITFPGGSNHRDDIIRDNLSWEQLLTEMGTYENFTETKIDFTKHMVIAIFEYKITQPCTVDITKVVEYKNKIVIIVKNLMMGDAQSPSVPYEIVKIPKRDKTIVFKREKQSSEQL